MCVSLGGGEGGGLTNYSMWYAIIGHLGESLPPLPPHPPRLQRNDMSGARMRAMRGLLRLSSHACVAEAGVGLPAPLRLRGERSCARCAQEGRGGPWRRGCEGGSSDEARGTPPGRSRRRRRRGAAASTCRGLLRYRAISINDEDNDESDCDDDR